MFCILGHQFWDGSKNPLKAQRPHKYPSNFATVLPQNWSSNFGDTQLDEQKWKRYSTAPRRPRHHSSFHCQSWPRPPNHGHAVLWAMLAPWWSIMGLLTKERVHPAPNATVTRYQQAPGWELELYILVLPWLSPNHHPGCFSLAGMWPGEPGSSSAPRWHAWPYRPWHSARFSSRVEL